MRLAHELLLVLGGLLLALAPFLYYVAFLALFPGVLCLLLSGLCGMAYLRQLLPTGAVGLRSHLSYFVVAAGLADLFAPGCQALCCPAVESLPLAVATALAILCSLYVAPFAHVRALVEHACSR